MSEAPDPIAISLRVIQTVADVGRRFPAKPEASNVAPFKEYFKQGALEAASLDKRDGGATRREALLRFLLLSAVVDQGPDIEGVRELVARTTSYLYEREVRIFHRPLDFFQYFNLSIDGIEACHAVVKAMRSEPWALANNVKNPGKYLLYAENASQSLGYAIYRWGAPIALPYLLICEAEADGREHFSALTGFLRQQHDGFPASTFGMTVRLKDHPRYGLGKAIGDKAANLFGKWVIHGYPLLLDPADAAWGPWSYEVPFDSNAGRVLFRTGIVTTWLTDEDLLENEIVQPGEAKGGFDYLRVTNMRGVGSARAGSSRVLQEINRDLCTNRLRTHVRAPIKVQMQHIPSILSIMDGSATPGQIDDGLIKVGTSWCFNHEAPNCAECPLRGVCAGANGARHLIDRVRT